MPFPLLFIFLFVLYRSKSNKNNDYSTNIHWNLFLYNYLLFFFSYFIQIEQKRRIYDSIGIVHYIYYINIFYSSFRTLSIQMTSIQQHIEIVFFFHTFIDPNQTKTFALSFTFYFPFRTLSIQIERKQLFDNIKSHSLYAFIPTIVHSHFSFDLLRFLSYRTKGKGRTRTSNKDWALSQCLLLSYRIFVSKESGEKIK